MATRAVNSPNESPHGDGPHKLPACSICEGPMVLAYDRYTQKVCVCTDCHTSITIPGSAWQVAHLKRQARKVERSVADRRRIARRASDFRMHS